MNNINPTQPNIKIDGDKVYINSPYNPYMNKKYRNCGGSFDRETKKWVFANTPATQKMIHRLWGEESPYVQVRLDACPQNGMPNKITVNEGYGIISWNLGEYTLATCQINKDFDRRYVKHGPGVLLEQGEWICKRSSLGSEDIALLVWVRQSFANKKELTVVQPLGISIPVSSPTPPPSTNNTIKE